MSILNNVEISQLTFFNTTLYYSQKNQCVAIIINQAHLESVTESNRSVTTCMNERNYNKSLN